MKHKSKLKSLTFSIKSETLFSGEVLYYPMCKEISKFISNGIWTQIIKIYDEYFLLDLEISKKLSFAECQEHIKGYILQEQEKERNLILNISYLDCFAEDEKIKKVENISNLESNNKSNFWNPIYSNISKLIKIAALN